MSYIYETKVVQKPRTSNWCSACNKDLPAGKPRKVVTWYSGEFANSTICNNQECYDKFAKDFEEND